MVRESVQTRLGRSADADYMRNPTDLFKSVEEKKWNDILDVLKESPSEASKWVVKKSKDGSVNWRRLPLHEACIRRPSDIVVAALIKAYPRGVRSTDSCGRLPLHHACIHGCSDKIIDQLLLAYPESIDVVDVWGKTPLLNAQASTSANKDSIIDALEKRPSHYAVRVAESKQKAAEEKQRDAFASAFESKFRDAQKKHSLVVKTLEEALAQLRAENNDMKMKYNSSSSVQTDLENQVIALSGTKSTLTEKVHNQSMRIATLEDKNANLTNLVDDLNVEKEDLTDNPTLMTKKNKDEATTIELLKSEMAENKRIAKNTKKPLHQQ
mmetsp:Transcript_59924/g.71352  ORF Transcript_59924/g.71352 Transcript_59924/m.71352 type:complete len:325 (+) Transcript_59924:181-1155(+)